MLFALFLCASALTTSAQQSDGHQNPRIISGGVLNGKAISLPKPAYPQIAKAARAGGTVVVQVTIDENGNVVSASAISGHPLLKAAAVQAAYGAKFSPTLLQGVPVKITGTINYNFILPMNWIEIGIELGEAEKGTNHYLSSVASSLYAQQFEMESKELRELEGTPRLSKNDVKAETSTSTAKQETPPVQKGVTTVVGSTANATPILNEEYLRRISAVISSLESKLMSDAIKSWYFSLGLIIGRTEENMKDNAEIQQTIERFRIHSINAPTGVSEGVVSKLQKLVSYYGKISFDENDRYEIDKLLREIRAVPIEKF